jgi:hypothetical protein
MIIPVVLMFIRNLRNTDLDLIMDAKTNLKHIRQYFKRRIGIE